jgi:RNA recognition motif-containing protein
MDESWSFRALTQYWITSGRGLKANAAPDNLVEAMKNIFVGNLAFNTSEEDVRQLFAAYGQVDRVTIVRDRRTDGPRGFGFVEMASSEEGNNHRCPEWNAPRRPRTECR